MASLGTSVTGGETWGHRGVREDGGGGGGGGGGEGPGGVAWVGPPGGDQDEGVNKSHFAYRLLTLLIYSSLQ